MTGTPSRLPDESGLEIADAMMALAVLAIAPQRLKGAVLHGWPGPMRDMLVATLRHWMPPCPWAKVPLGVGLERLLGGLDLTATLTKGKPVLQTGLLAGADGGVIVLAGAEIADRAVAAAIGQAIDLGEIVIEREGFAGRAPARFALLALDESVEGERGCSSFLRERVAFEITIPAVPMARAGSPGIDVEEIRRARVLLPDISLSDDHWQALCRASVELGVSSLRAPLFAAEAARALAALDGRKVVEPDDVSAAARLAFAHRATRVPVQDSPPPPPEESPAEPDAGSNADTEQSDAVPEDIVLAAIMSALPKGLLDDIARRVGAQRGFGGTSGTTVKSKARGRPTGVRPGQPGGGRRVDIVSTLRQAAPWQGVRRKLTPQLDSRPRVHVRADDLRIKSFEERSETVTIFAVDASGSAALERLGEAKGAVELLLADCYVRRDKVALLAFRKSAAEVLLPPTRSLVRAKRALRDLAGGGGTPLASGIDLAVRLALSARHHGMTPTIVLLTDGRANITREGQAGRQQAEADALSSARAGARENIRVLVVDTASRAQPFCRTLAETMAARYIALPFADASRLAGSVRGLPSAAPTPRAGR